MNELLSLTGSVLAGMTLGAMFFGGLSWTLHKSLSAKRPALWISSSSLLRMSAVVAGFYVVAGEHWQRWVTCLAGFVLARIVFGWVTAPRNKTMLHRPEVGHAPES